MFPMISGVEELRRAKEIFRDVEAELAREGVRSCAPIRLGAMIEIPSAAVVADELAAEADFFSVGTNDLVQYLLAVDRGNQRVASLYDPCHPAVVRTLMVIFAAARKRGIPAAVCGELGGDPLWAPLLIGLGVHELSMTPAALPEVRFVLRHSAASELRELAAKVVDEVRARGPFMSMADFVNRRLINQRNPADDFGLKGALQAAIDKTTINDNAIAAAGGTFQAPKSPADMALEDPNKHLYGNMLTSKGWWGQNSAYPSIKANQRFPSLKAMSKNPSASKPDIIAGLGAPGIVTQMDVLNSIGPNLTARSDTFVVRAYGEALDDAGNVIGKAWVEVIVQRTAEYVAMTVGQKYPDYVEPNRRKLAYRVNSSGGKEYDKQVLPEMYEISPAPTPPSSTALEKTALLQEQRLNRILGRRFRPASLRWLTANEI